MLYARIFLLLADTLRIMCSHPSDRYISLLLAVILIIAPIAMAFAGPMQSMTANDQKMHMWSMNKDASTSLDTLSDHSSHPSEADNSSHQDASCADQCEHCDYCHGATIRLRIVACAMISASPLSSFTPMIGIDLDVDIKPPKLSILVASDI